MTQSDLLAWTPPPMHRDGATYDPDQDYKRLNAQQKRVFDVMRGNVWRSLSEISKQTGDPEASVSARLRDFRKMGKTVERRRLEHGLHEYRVVIK